MPAARRAIGDQALLYIGNIRERFTIVTLDEQEYSEMQGRRSDHLYLEYKGLPPLAGHHRKTRKAPGRGAVKGAALTGAFRKRQ
jgi:hypothetical protein